MSVWPVQPTLEELVLILLSFQAAMTTERSGTRYIIPLRAPGSNTKAYDIQIIIF